MSVQTMTVKQLTAAMNVCRRTIERWVRDGDFPAPMTLASGTIRWLESDVANWVETKRPQVVDEKDRALAAGDVLAGAIHDRRSAIQPDDSASLDAIEADNRRQHPERDELLT